MFEFIDRSSKTCEVTGREMGDEETFRIPFSSLKPGPLGFDTTTHLNHHITIKEVGKDNVVVDVHDWRGNHQGGPYTLHVGDSKRYNYYFGEWSYGFSVSLIWSY